MTVEAQITINRNQAAVWSVITNIRDAAKIISQIETIEILHEPLNGLVGLKWRETRMYFGKPSAIDKWITDVVENKSYQTRAEMDGFIFLTTMTLTEHDDNIILTSTHETQAQGILAKIKSLPMIFFRGMLKKNILQDLVDVKAAVEQK
jgi:hypothetical protein